MARKSIRTRSRVLVELLGLDYACIILVLMSPFTSHKLVLYNNRFEQYKSKPFVANTRNMDLP